MGAPGVRPHAIKDLSQKVQLGGIVGAPFSVLPLTALQQAVHGLRSLMSYW